MIRTSVRIFISAVVSNLLFAASAAGQSSAFTYQGQLKSGGAPVNGTADLDFYIYDADAGGSLVAGPVSHVGVVISDGLFAVPLDFGPPAAVFDGNPRWLQVDVDATPLSPRQELTAAPYSHFSALPWVTSGTDVSYTLGNVGIGTSTPASALDLVGDLHALGRVAIGNESEFGTGTGIWGGYSRFFDFSERIQDFSAATFWTPLLSVTTVDPLADLTGGDAKVIIHALLGAQTPDESERNIAQLQGSELAARHSGTGNVDLMVGATADCWLNGAGSVTDAIGLNAAAFASELSSGTIQNALALAVSTGTSSASSAITTNTGIHVYTPVTIGPITNNYGLYIEDQSVAQSSNYALYSAGGNSYFADRVGIGTTAPTAPLHVEASTGNTIFSKTTGGRGVVGWATSNFGGIGVSGDHVQSGNYGLLGTIDAGVTGVAQSFVNVGGSFANTDPGGVAVEVTQGLLDIQGTGDGTELLRFSTERPWMFRQLGSGASAGLQLLSTVGLKEFHITAAGGTNVATFFADDGNPRMAVNGTMSCKVLTVTGADLAEKFPSADDDIEPGTVMEIDPENDGHLRIARSAYSALVAGIVSGAGNLPAGAVLGNLDGHENAPPIALSGRVWVRCDAGDAAIERGDLLTSSATMGHAMKAVDRDRAQGATLGKAMTPLAHGERGLVLVLVNLQ